MKEVIKLNILNPDPIGFYFSVLNKYRSVLLLINTKRVGEDFLMNF